MTADRASNKPLGGSPDNPMTILGELLLGPSGDRGQPGNGVAKLVRARTDALAVVQSKRGGVDDRSGGRGTPWAVAVVLSDREHRYTPEAARELAAHLLAAADECERFEEEDRA